MAKTQKSNVTEIKKMFTMFFGRKKIKILNKYFKDFDIKYPPIRILSHKSVIFLRTFDQR